MLTLNNPGKYDRLSLKILKEPKIAYKGNNNKAKQTLLVMEISCIQFAKHSFSYYVASASAPPPIPDGRPSYYLSCTQWAYSLLNHPFHKTVAICDHKLSIPAKYLITKRLDLKLGRLELESMFRGLYRVVWLSSFQHELFSG